MNPPRALPDPDVVEGKIIKTEKNVRPSDDEYDCGYKDKVIHITEWYEYECDE